MMKHTLFAASAIALPLSLPLSLALANPAFAQDEAAEAGTAIEIAPANGPANAPAPMTADDLVKAPRLGGATTTKDGRFAVYPVTTTSDDYARSTTHYLLDLTVADAQPVPVALGNGAHSAQFGSDDWLYFLRQGDEDSAGTQVYRVALEADGNITGPIPVTALGNDVSGFKLSPDANNIAVWREMARDCETFGCEGDATAHLPGPGNGRLYKGEDGFIRHWDTWQTPGTFSRVRVYGLENGQAAGDGIAIDGRLAEGSLIGDTPTKPFGGSEEIAWAADSQSIFFTAKMADANEPTSTDKDIFQAHIANGTLENLTIGNPAYDNLPAPSPDGKYLAYVAMERPGYESDRLVIHLRDLDSGETRALTQDFDRSFYSLAWTPDSRWIIATAQDVLDTPAFRVDPVSGAVERLDLVEGNEARLGGVTPLPGNRLLFTRSSVQNPSELYLSSDWSAATRLTDVAYTAFEGRAAVNTTRFSFTGANGATVWGQIHKPSWVAGELPVILYVHGGPQGSFNDGWSSRWNPRVVASQGYAVVSVDFHGSTGYGQAFTDAINNDWGGKPLIDLQLGLAAAGAQDAQLNTNRACAMGASYGGYMMNWIAGNWPDGFRCLIQHAGLFDMRSFYYTTEELWFPRWDFGGSYSAVAENYERWNPVNHVDSWRTPMLVVAGEKDFRVPYTQGIQSFTALQERGIPAELLVFPDENHWVLGAKNSLQWHETVFNWLDRWLKEQ